MDNHTSFKHKVMIFQVFASYLLVIIGAIGVFFILEELNEIKEQNKALLNQNLTLERTLRQSYRPLGVARHSWEEKELMIVRYPSSDTKEKDKITFQIVNELKNQGKGLLSSLGFVYFLSNELINFRDKFLNGEIAGVNFDPLPTFARRTPLLPGETQITVAECENVPFERRYFLYILFLYEDQDGNLYDTEHLEVLPFLEPVSTEMGLEARLDKNEVTYRNETYNSYTNEDKQLLCKVLSSLQHELQIFICN